MLAYTYVLAGGRGQRLHPLTKDRSKPAVPFGGIYRIIDFTLSNCLNSGLRHVGVLTQYKSLSLESHIHRAWHVFDAGNTGSISTLPPQQRVDESWYLGTANAVFQNLYSLDRFEREHTTPGAVVILAGDHIYKMDYGRMIEFHLAHDADLTVGAIRVARAEARGRFGVFTMSDHQRVAAFEEKPEWPSPIPDDPDGCFASMGIYVFRPSLLRDCLHCDSTDPSSQHDFGRDIVPRMAADGRVFAFPLALADRSGSEYWRDVGTLESYWRSHLDLLGEQPAFALHGHDWPMHTCHTAAPPARVLSGRNGTGSRVVDSLLSPGCVVDGSEVSASVLSPNVTVLPGATVHNSILLDSVVVGRGAHVHRAIVDKHASIPDEGLLDGFDLPPMSPALGVDGDLVVLPAHQDSPVSYPLCPALSTPRGRRPLARSPQRARSAVF
jgi:glucose-1-phosphate adenylyltransferase